MSKMEPMLDRELVDILVCPVCRTPLQLVEAKDLLNCGNCHRQYPIRDGIPVLLVEESSGSE